MRVPSPLLGLLSLGALSAHLLAGCAPSASHEQLPQEEDVAKDGRHAASPAAPSQDGGARSEEPALTVLLALSNGDAPAPTRTFYWGKPQLVAPGFYIAPDSLLTIALDEQNRLRYSSWRGFSALTKMFGDDPSDFPLSGARPVVHPAASGSNYEATVDQASLSTPEHFLFRTHIVDTLNDYVEGLEGTKDGAGWTVVYTQKGKYFGAAMDARAEGVLYAGDPRASARSAGEPSVWSAPVELTAPNFVGPPVDQLKVVLDAQGQLRSFAFDEFPRHAQTFGSGSADYPYEGTATRGDVTVTVDPAVAPTPSHFVLRYHVASPSRLDDYVEGLDGTREGDTLVVRYFIKGKLYGSEIDAHAAGVLVPASE